MCFIVGGAIRFYCFRILGWSKQSSVTPTTRFNVVRFVGDPHGLRPVGLYVTGVYTKKGFGHNGA